MKAQEAGALLLAAGQSSRFGGADKLAAPLQGRPLVHHAAMALSGLDLGKRIVVSSRPLPVDWRALGFEELRLPGGDVMSASIAAGVAQMRATGLKACLIALADMPFVPASHFEAMIAHGAHPVLATGHGGKNMVPALFAREIWGELESLSGDSGARRLLKDAPAIEVPAQWLADIDTPEELARFTQPAGDR